MDKLRVRLAVATIGASLVLSSGLTPANADTVLNYSLATGDVELRNNASVISDSGGVLELQMTPNIGSQRGGFFAKSALNLKSSFVLDGEIFLGDETDNANDGFDGRGADGAAFTLFSQIPSSLTSGAEMGYSGLGTLFAIEWDTYHNSTLGDLGSEGNDMSMALVKNTADHMVAGATYAPVQLIPRSTMVADDGTWRKFQIAWNGPSERISVRYDIDANGSFEADEVIFDSIEANLTGAGGLFEASGGVAYWGFTASTGMYVNDHRVKFNTNALQVIVPPPPPYMGPILTAANPNPVSVGEPVTIAGSRLSSVNEVKIDGVAATDLVVGDTSLTFTIPEVEPGLKSLVVTSSYGQLTVQDALTVLAAAAREVTTTAEPKPSIRRTGSDVRVAIYNPVGAGKIQIMLNGQEVAWVRASSADDPKLRSTDGVAYLVRSLELASNQKNVIEIYVSGERIRRAAYGN